MRNAMRLVTLMGRPSTFAPPAAGIVTAAEIVNDISIAITAPSAMSVPMQTNGIVLRVATSGSALAASLDKSKISISASDQGWDVNGNQVTRARSIKVRAVLIKPYDEEENVYQPNAGEFYLVLDDILYNQDPTWKTTIAAINFSAGWLPDAAAESYSGGAVTRSDSLPYPATPFKIVTPPYRRCASGSNIRCQIAVINQFARDLSQVACVEAWGFDGTNSGAVARTSTYARSSDTPNDATTKGGPVPLYEPMVDPSGLTGGQCYFRARVKPWIGPSVDSTSMNDNWPTHNPAQQVPFAYDTDGSHAPIYLVLSNEQASAPAGKTLCPQNSTTVTTADMTGVYTSLSAALAGTKVYPDLGSALMAGRRVNRSATSVPIADGASFQRTTPHDDISGIVVVCPTVSGSALGSDAGAYSLWQSCGSTTNFPPGITMAEIRSASGLPSTDCRWRGRHSDGSSLSFTSRVLPTRIRLRGLTFDSTGVTVASENVIAGQSATGASALSETAASFMERVDCIARNTTSVAPGSSTIHRNAGFIWDIRTESHNDNNVAGISPGGATYSAGLCASIGCYYNVDSGFLLIEPSCILGARCRNVIFGVGAVSNRPLQRGRIFGHVEMDFTNAMTSPIIGRGSYPIYGGEAYSFIHVHGTLADGTSQPISFTADGIIYDCDNLILQHIGSAFGHSGQQGMGRLNFLYNEQGWLRVDKRGTICYSAFRNWNNKGDTTLAPETPTSGGRPAHSTAQTWFKGDIVISGGIGYQAKQDVPLGIAVSDTTYWYQGTSSGTAYGKQPLRQGNNAIRYHAGCRGNVAVDTASGELAPGPNGNWGIAWGADESYTATLTNMYNDYANDDYTPKPGGDLVNRVAAGMAMAPFGVFGRVLLNDGTDAAGPLQLSSRAIAA